MTAFDAKVLIVDDDLEMLAAMEVILKRRGFDVACKSDKTSALDYLANNSPDLIISDIEIPQRHGMELLAELKRLYPYIPVIVSAGFGDTYSVREAMLLGADEYLCKPFEPEELGLMVERFIPDILKRKSISSTL